MRDESPLTINDDDFNIIVNLHPTDVTHFVLVIRRESGPMVKHGQSLSMAMSMLMAMINIEPSY